MALEAEKNKDTQLASAVGGSRIRSQGLSAAPSTSTEQQVVLALNHFFIFSLHLRIAVVEQVCPPERPLPSVRNKPRSQYRPIRRRRLEREAAGFTADKSGPPARSDGLAEK